jgi:ABC-type transporter lipoprotein component MlaA
MSEQKVGNVTVWMAPEAWAQMQQALITAHNRIRELEAERDQLKAEAYKSNRVIRDAWAERDALRIAMQVIDAALATKEQAK